MRRVTAIAATLFTVAVTAVPLPQACALEIDNPYIKRAPLASPPLPNPVYRAATAQPGYNPPPVVFTPPDVDTSTSANHFHWCQNRYSFDSQSNNNDALLAGGNRRFCSAPLHP